MLDRNFQPFQLVSNFLGVNAKDSAENMLPGEWHKDSINVYSTPRGAIGMRRGFSSLTTASIGAAVAWCGFYQFRTSGKTDYFLGGADDGKLWQYVSNGYTELYAGLGSEDDDDRFCFATLNDICVITDDGNNAPMKWEGTGSATSLGGTLVTADFCIEAWRYIWLHSTVDPRLMYYCTTIGDPESGYVSFLNFDEDPREVIGAARQGDDLIIAKEWSLFRVQYTGSEPKFPKYRIESKVGFVSHYASKQTPDGNVIFLAPDFNVYMLVGDDPVPVGDNIKDYLKAGVKARLKYAVMGLLQERSQVWISFTYLSTSTTNDRTVVMDYSRPYTDKWGQTQYPWFIYNIAANCFAEIYSGGAALLYHGGYVGKMYRDDTGTIDDATAISSTYKSKIFSFGDPTLEKKFSKIMLSYDNKGSHDLTINITTDDNAATQKTITQSMSGGSGYNTLWDQAYWDTDYWASETDIDTGRDIDRQGKLIQVVMGTTGSNEDWNVLNYTLMAKPLRRGTVRSREST